MKVLRLKNFCISNGSGIGVSVYVSGCPLHCKGCFNAESWDPDQGRDFDKTMLEKIMNLLNVSTIDHLSVLGGEPLAEWNTEGVEKLIKESKKRFPEKEVWLWTGYMPEELNEKQKEVTALCDYVTYGRFEMEKANLNRRYSGSDNQFTVRRDGTIIEASK